MTSLFSRLQKLNKDGTDEMVCQRCKRRHGVVWFAPSDIWNAVMRGGDRANGDEFGFCCPICFMLLAEERGVTTTGWLVCPFDDGPVKRAADVVLLNSLPAVLNLIEAAREAVATRDVFQSGTDEDPDADELFYAWRDANERLREALAVFVSGQEEPCDHDWLPDPHVMLPTNPPKARLVCAKCGAVSSRGQEEPNG